VTLTRHFPSPWTAEDDGACFIVRDANRQAVAYVYYFDEESGAAQTANLVTGEEAQRTSPRTSPSCRSCSAPRGSQKQTRLFKGE
jgi:hypothetical protein